MAVTVLIIVAAAYVIGATPFGYLAGRAKGIDIREHGSGNIGATNVIRTLGKGVGLPVFVLDVVKGMVPVLLAQWAVEHYSLTGFSGTAAPILAAVAAILGHNFTFWLGFRGGKGVATSAGALLALMPVALAAGVLVWLLLFFFTKYVAIASIGSSAAIPVAEGIDGALGDGLRPAYLALGCLVTVMVVVRHGSNIRRLRDGTEHRFGKKGES